MRGVGLEIVEIPWSDDGGTIDVAQLEAGLNENTAAVVLQNPNFLGVLEPLETVGQVVGPSSAAYVCVVNPISLGVIRPPGAFGADIVVGDGQPLGLPLSFGGPYVGFLATRERYLRKMPGRVCGETRDVDGKRGFVLTLKTREQDIRRETRHLEYLYEPGTLRNGGNGLSRGSGTRGASRGGAPELEPKPSCGRWVDGPGRGLSKVRRDHFQRIRRSDGAQGR